MAKKKRTPIPFFEPHASEWITSEDANDVRLIKEFWEEFDEDTNIYADSLLKKVGLKDWSKQKLAEAHRYLLYHHNIPIISGSYGYRKTRNVSDLIKYYQACIYETWPNLQRATAIRRLVDQESKSQYFTFHNPEDWTPKR